MFYLAKFCRICIRTDGKLYDIDTTDEDCIKLSDKLKQCTDMVISRESLSTQICTGCIQKLRVSYQFHKMCKRSTSILQQYLTELLSVAPVQNADKFVNSELRVTIPSRLPKLRRKRVGKDERCSLLKKLLSKITEEQMVTNIHISGLSKLCDMLPPPPPLRYYKRPSSKPHSKAGGLRSLINFTKQYDFGYQLDDDNAISRHVDLTPLEKLERFTETFFYDHFGDYREVILNAKDNINFESDEDEEDLFEENEEHSFETVFLSPGLKVKQEIVIVEPDIKIKRELDYDDDMCDDDDDDDDMFSDVPPEDVSQYLPLDQPHCSKTSNFRTKPDNRDRFRVNYSNTNFVEQNSQYLPLDQPHCSKTSNFRIKRENLDNFHVNYNKSNFVGQNSQLAEIIPVQSSSSRHYSNMQQNGMVLNVASTSRDLSRPGPSHAQSEPVPSTSSATSPNMIGQLRVVSLDLLQKSKSISPHSVRCRTRGNPFINPQLKRQFQFRSFKCEVCNRRFKSPGYLKAHRSKLKHF